MISVFIYITCNVHVHAWPIYFEVCGEILSVAKFHCTHNFVKFIALGTKVLVAVYRRNIHLTFHQETTYSDLRKLV